MQQVRGTLWVLPDMSAAQIDEIVKNFTVLLQKQVMVDIVEKPGLIGGFVAHIDGKIYDASIRGKLNEFEHMLNNE